ncbi:GumC domain-containing protein [Frondihabitans cladoniiphilus]|uniref:Capsular polysaccharide biosynthesis protein n=1 Tax=Frondihabitans cladoniiphilus TaxID=715785 RepID=A0ABP8VZN3_9MICO
MREGNRFRVLLIVLVVVLTGLGTTIGFLGARSATTKYTSTSVLLWDPSSLRYGDASAYVPDSASLVIQVAAQMTLVQSDSVIDPAAKKVGLTATRLRSDIEVLPGSSASEFLVSSTAKTARDAQDLTKAVVDSYAAQTRATISGQLTAQASALQGPINTLTAQLANLPSTSPLADAVATQLSQDIAQQQSLQSGSSGVTTPLSVTQAASLPTSPSSKSPKTMAVIGGAVGFVIGIGIAVLVSLRRDSRRDLRRVQSSSPAATRRTPETV